MILALSLLALSPLSGWMGHAQSGTATPNRNAGVTMHATGTFVVKMAPAEASAIGQQAGIGRMTIDKTFSGMLEGTSQGEMLTAGTEATGAGAYVALERITGSIDSHKGEFLLMHDGTMLKNSPGAWHVVIVPNSGTGELAGIAGKMTIIIAGGKHSYEFAYTIG